MLLKNLVEDNLLAIRRNRTALIGMAYTVFKSKYINRVVIAASEGIL